MKETKTYLDSSTSFNKLIVEVYKKEALRHEEKNGFAFIGQKLTLKGLKVLTDAKLTDGTLIPKGSVAYLKEEQLHTQPWAQKAFESTYFDQPFLIVDMSYVEFIDPVAPYIPVDYGYGTAASICSHTVKMAGRCAGCGVIMP